MKTGCILFTSSRMSKLGYIWLIVLVSACSFNQTDFEKIESFYTTYKNGSFDSYRYIVVINSKGGCLSCNNIFAKMMSKDLENEKVLFILSGQGTKVDISAYLDRKEENVLLDLEDDFSKLNIVNYCAVLEVENNRINNVTRIDVKNIVEYTPPWQS
jgi:hypothetical protein